MKHFILSLQFLSRLYLPWMIEGEDDMFARSLKFFPLAGCIIGLLDAGVLWLLLRVFTPLTAGILVVLFDIALTGGLHMDGLADTIDGLSSHRHRTLPGLPLYPEILVFAGPWRQCAGYARGAGETLCRRVPVGDRR